MLNIKELKLNKNTFALILIGLMLITFFITCDTSTEATLKSFDVSFSETTINTGGSIKVTVTAKDDSANVYTDFNETVTFSCSNSNVEVDSSTKTSPALTNGVLTDFEVKLVNKTNDDQSGKIVVESGDYKGTSSNNITVAIKNNYSSGRIVFPYRPKNNNVKVINNIERNIKLGNTDIKDPILLGIDKSVNFVTYIKEVNKVVKFAHDGSLGAIIIDSDDLNVIAGDIIAGTIDREGNKLYLLKRNNNTLSVMFYDISGNVRKEPKTIGEATTIVKKYVTANVDDYIFEAIGMEVLNGNPVIVIRERSIGKKIAAERPTFVVLNEDGEVQNVTPLITPPLITAFGTDYWSTTQTEKLDFQVCIEGGNIYILWGSGYTVNGNIGYMVQKLDASGTEIGSFTRVIRDMEIPEDGMSVEAVSYSENEETNYIARGITVNLNNVYVRVKMDGKNYIDVFDGERVYSQQYDTNVTIGETQLDAPRNILVYAERIIVTSDKGVHIISLKD